MFKSDKIDYDTNSMEDISSELCKYIGLKIKARRSFLGISQQNLANALGLSFQQIQKYERGVNRIASTTIYHIAKILQTNIEYFFDGFRENNLSLSDNEADPFEGYEGKMLLPETMDLVTEYYEIEDKDLRRDVINFIKSIKKLSKKIEDKSNK